MSAQIIHIAPRRAGRSTNTVASQLLQVADMVRTGSARAVALTVVMDNGATRELFLGSGTTDRKAAHYGACRLADHLLWPDEGES